MLTLNNRVLVQGIRKNIKANNVFLGGVAGYYYFNILDRTSQALLIVSFNCVREPDLSS
jgi:hypothetical protein